MKSCLIGYSGLIGGTLLKSHNFSDIYRKINIHEIKNKAFDLVICAGTSAEKWKANLNPLEDQKNIDFLIQNLSYIKAKKFVLISTVDVFKNPYEVDEKSIIIDENTNPYGENRRKLEIYIMKKFKDYNIVRLPAIVGNGLKKNALFDIKNNNNINLIDSRNKYQFYPLKNLWKDINKTLELEKNIMHLTSEPISIESIYSLLLKKVFKNEISKIPTNYNMKSIYSELFYGLPNYQYDKKYVLNCILEYLNN